MSLYVSFSFIFAGVYLNFHRHFGPIKRLEHSHGYSMFNQQERSHVPLINYYIIQSLNDPLKLSQITSASISNSSF